MPPSSLSDAERNRRLIGSAAALLSSLMVAIDSTIANVALPHMQAAMTASQEQVVWVLTSYLIAMSIFTPLSAWLASRFGRKRVMVISAIGFTFASALCGASVGLPMMVAARMLQGASGAGLIPLAQAMLLDNTRPEHQGRAMAIYGTGMMFGPLIGPTLGGFLIETSSWRWVFFVNLPLGVLSVLGMIYFMVEHRDKTPTRFDHFGFVVTSLFLGLLQLVLDRGPMLDWLDSIEVRIEVALLALCAWLMTVHMTTAANSFVRPRLFTDRNFAVGCLLNMVIGAVALAAVPMMTVMIQQLLGYSALLTGLISMPRGLGTIISMLAASRLIGRYDTRIFLVLGLGLSALGLYMLSGIQLMVGGSTLMWAGFIQGLGSSLMMVSLSTMAFTTLSPLYRNEGTAIYALTRNMASSLGISYLQMQSTWNVAKVRSRLVEGLRPDNPIMALRLPHIDLGLPHDAAQMLAGVHAQAEMVAYTDTYWMLCLVALAMIPTVMVMRPMRRRPFVQKQIKGG